MKRPVLARVGRYALFVSYLFLATSILLFAVLEIPAVARAAAPNLPYYSIRRTYRPDSALVFTPLHIGSPQRVSYRFRGDLYSDRFGVDAPPIDVEMTYDSLGFRTNRAGPPYQVAVFGDSYVESGETDRDTFSELLREASGLPAANRGRAWYGPYQYVELLRQEAADLRPAFALFMFYSGNDIIDIAQYERWKLDGRYWRHDDRFWKASFPRRYLLVLRQTASRAKRALMKGLSRSRPVPAEMETGHPRDLAFVNLENDTMPMAMGNHTPEAPAAALLETPEWQSLRRLAAEFQVISQENGIQPVLVYLPTKTQTYADRIDPDRSGMTSVVLEGQRLYAASQAVALETVAADIQICFVNLLPHFRDLANKGELLYHPFDTHWNSRGRRAAAEVVAAALLDRCRDPATR